MMMVGETGKKGGREGGREGGRQRKVSEEASI